MNGNEKRKSKILRNSYFEGNNIKDDQKKQSLAVDNDYIKDFLSQSYDPDRSMSYEKIRNEIHDLIKTNTKLSEILDENVNKKFNKNSINEVFNIVLTHFKSNSNLVIHINFIYMFDIICNITGIKSRGLFDLLDMEYKKKLIEELDDIYNILDNYENFNKMF